MGNPRNRERITRGSPDEQQCDGCRFTQFEHDVNRKKVAGKWVALCSTCFSEANSGDLLEYLETIEETQGADVNHELMEQIREHREADTGENVGA